MRRGADHDGWWLAARGAGLFMVAVVVDGRVKREASEGCGGRGIDGSWLVVCARRGES